MTKLEWRNEEGQTHCQMSETAMS